MPDFLVMGIAAIAAFVAIIAFFAFISENNYSNDRKTAGCVLGVSLGIVLIFGAWSLISKSLNRPIEKVQTYEIKTLDLPNGIKAQLAGNHSSQSGILNVTEQFKRIFPDGAVLKVYEYSDWNYGVIHCCKNTYYEVYDKNGNALTK